MMAEQNQTPESEAGPTRMQRIGEWLQDPMGSVVAASAASIGAFGVVLSGTWMIHSVMN